ncbi:MAG TPA: phosphoglycolate phosphatase [Acidiferrobacteraceae bacterium]|nr:phosphoglycolate phosphatase [Acidiferrobacteraceae bacterium]
MSAAAVIAARLVLVDLDGTLVDTAPDLSDAVNRTMTDLQRAPWPEAKIATWIGNGVPRLIKRALTGTLQGEPDAALFERAAALFARHYRAHVADRSQPFPGAVQALAALQQGGYRLVCITNKAEEFTLPLLEALQLRRFFDLVLSGDSLPRCKPDPMPLYHACTHFGVTAQQAVLVGDSESDILAAKAASMPVICVQHGYSQGMDLQSLGPDVQIASLHELPACLRLAA